MHDGDRERATSLAHNLKYNALTARKNPYFNKKKQKEPSI
jgi:hypothetical protein